MRLMSFSMTKAAFVNGTKTVTRRLGWKNLKPGDVLMGVEKAQGLKRGEKVKKLGAIQVVSIRREPLCAILDEEDGSVREGLPELTQDEFVRHFCKAMRIRPTDEVTRVEFKRFHVHDRSCDRVATIVYRSNGETREWRVGAFCSDTDETIRDHFARFKPGEEFVSVTFSTAVPSSDPVESKRGCEDCGDLAKRRTRCPRCKLLVCSWCWGHVHGNTGLAQAVRGKAMCS